MIEGVNPNHLMLCPAVQGTFVMKNEDRLCMLGLFYLCLSFLWFDPAQRFIEMFSSLLICEVLVIATNPMRYHFHQEIMMGRIERNV